jgi:uncharacterized damage-inducible protein DinB
MPLRGARRRYIMVPTREEAPMQEMTRWLERKFAYLPPAGEFPMIVERLRGTPARVADRVAPSARIPLARRDGDGWSIQEHVGHLLDLEPLWTIRVEEFLAGARALSTADMSNRKTYEAHHGERAVAAIVAEFSVARSRLVARLDGATDTDVERVAIHPRLKRPMGLVDLCFFVAEHDDHHLALVTRLAHD